MDGKGFLVGQGLKVKVICRTDWQNFCYTQNGSHSIVTVIECIAADGRVIPPMYLYKGGKHQLGSYDGMQDKEQPIFL
jgi:hypothetical protein